MAFALLSSRRLTFCVKRFLAQTVQHCELSSKVPDTPTWTKVDEVSLPEVPEIDSQMIELLERLSLVEFNNKAGVERLRSAIQYANQIHVVNTDGVEPMYSVLEGEELLLRDDCVTEGNCKQEILKNAKKLEEDYFVAPPGNIPLVKKDKTDELS